ncbi:hypothetical protein V144x_04020 [Gimesia aquarii]|uniref:Uncharacterized protein n=1 Tax=Gimesia aquarii TaxID=2527964 RepID=A0A517VPM7_9PLAN|nr:hypothetical protein V144x_04020 [Gimesia aquarii]
MNTTNQILCLILMITVSSFTGCGQSQSKSPTLTPVTAPKREKLVSITDGPRPTAIRGAAFVDTHRFHEIENTDEKWVCIEGTVNRTGEIMGASFVSVTCPTCGTHIYCESLNQLDKFAIPNGIRIIIRGRVFHDNKLAESMPVSQNEINVALDRESNAELMKSLKSATDRKEK